MATRVYQSGAFIIYTAPTTVELTQTIAEDTNNYNDAITLLLTTLLTQTVAENSDNYLDAIALQVFDIIALAIADDINNYNDALNSYTPSIHLTDNINNFLDDIGIIGLSYAININDFIPPIVDAFAAFFARTLALSENADNFQDAISSYLAGAATQNPGDNVGANLGDNVGMVLGLELKLGDQFFITDSSNFVLGFGLSLADSINNFQDALNTPTLNEIALLIAESINNFEDRITVEFARTNPTIRTALTSYIRRYLNDVEVD